MQRRTLALLCLLMVWPTAAHANSGMAFFDLSIVQLLGLGTIIVWIEALLIKGAMAATFWRGVKVSALGNLLSYLVGLPFLWAVSSSSPLYVPMISNTALSVILLLVTFSLTCAIELPVIKGLMKAPWLRALKVCVVANIVSYLLLSLFGLGFLIFFPTKGLMG